MVRARLPARPTILRLCLLGLGLVALFDVSHNVTNGQANQSDALPALALGDDCAALDGGADGTIASAVVFLFEVLLGSDNQLGCLREHNLYLAWLIQGVNITVSVVLLLNMLIASMSTTFNNNDEVGDVNYAFCYSQLVQSAGNMPVAPAPFNLIGLPARLLVGIVRRCLPLLTSAAAKCTERAGAPAFAELSPATRLDPPPARPGGLRRRPAHRRAADKGRQSRPVGRAVDIQQNFGD